MNGVKNNNLPESGPVSLLSLTNSEAEVSRIRFLRVWY